MSQIFYEYVQQEDLIADSKYILVCSKCDPFQRFQKIPISDDKEKYPDFIKTYYSFKLVTVLYAEGDVPQDIIVVPANWEAELEQHKLFYLEGIDESPIYLAYDSEVDLHQTEHVILFLKAVPSLEGMFIFSYEFGYESIDQVSRVVTFINQMK